MSKGPQGKKGGVHQLRDPLTRASHKLPIEAVTTMTSLTLFRWFNPVFDGLTPVLMV